MDKWSKIRCQASDAQEELYKINDKFRETKVTTWTPNGVIEWA